mmetsp:Transcript_29379/g.57238  ORF Transcript_29379/g.57238 Transcript_29379/m.57238 type:complete len:228 (+) Transcript_29379:72-755(+)
MYVNAAMYLEVFQTSFIFHGISRSALDDLSSGNSFAYDYSTYGQRLQRPHLTSSSSPSSSTYSIASAPTLSVAISFVPAAPPITIAVALSRTITTATISIAITVSISAPVAITLAISVPSAAAAAAAAIAVATISIVAPAVSIAAAAVSSSFVLRRLAPGKALIDLFTTLSGATKSTSQATRLPVSNSSSSFNVDENTSFIDLASVSIFVGFLEVPRRFEFNEAVPT